MTVTRISVRGYHEDRFGHVNNARYLEFLEEGRWAHLEERGLGLTFFEEHGVFPVVVRLCISYRRPGSAGDTVEVLTGVKNAGRRKVVIEQTIRLASTQEVCAEAEVTAVFLDSETSRPIALSEPILEAWPELRSGGSD